MPAPISKVLWKISGLLLTTFTDNDDSSTKRSQLYALGIQSYWDGSNWKVSMQQRYPPLDADVIDANSGENFVVALFELLEDYKLIPKEDFDEHLKKVYALDEKEKF